MKALGVLKDITERMVEMNTHCVIALITNVSKDDTQLYIFTSDVVREEINCYWKETGLLNVGLSTSHADIFNDEFKILKVTDIADTVVV